jgi:hypothetical protein
LIVFFQSYAQEITGFDLVKKPSNIMTQITIGVILKESFHRNENAKGTAPE